MLRDVGFGEDVRCAWAVGVETGMCGGVGSSNLQESELADRLWQLGELIGAASQLLEVRHELYLTRDDLQGRNAIISRTSLGFSRGSREQGRGCSR